MEKDKSKLNCSFCGKSQSKVKKLIAGPNTYICNECVDLCNAILDVEEKEKKVDDFSISKPREIFDYLDEIIVGQDDAKKKLSVAVTIEYCKSDCGFLSQLRLFYDIQSDDRCFLHFECSCVRTCCTLNY